MLALREVPDGVSPLGNHGLGVFPVRMLYVCSNNLVLWRTRMGDGIDVIPVEREPSDQIVRAFTQDIPFDFRVLQFGDGSIENPQLALYGFRGSDHVVGV